MSPSLLIESGISLPFSVYQPTLLGEQVLPVTESARLHRENERKRGRSLGCLFESEGAIGPGFRAVFRRRGMIPKAAAIEERFETSLERGDGLEVYRALADRFSLAVEKTNNYQPLDPEKPIVFEPKEGIRVEMGLMATVIDRLRHTSNPIQKQLTVRFCDYSALPARKVSSSQAEWFLAKEVVMSSLASLQGQRIRKAEATLVVSVARKLLFDTASLERKILAVDGRILIMVQGLDGPDSRRRLFEIYLELAKLQGGELFLLD